MKLTNHAIIRISLLPMVLSFSLAGQGKDRLTLPREVRLNERQPPERVLEAIGVKPGMTIGEVGAGRGRYTVQIADRVGPSGMVYANDIEASYLRSLNSRAAELGFTNIKTIEGTVSDPLLPEGVLDMVIMVNVVHCLDKPVEIFRSLRKSLKPDGVIAIVEGSLDKNPEAAGEWFLREKLLKIFTDAGYTLVGEETFLPMDNIFILKSRGPTH